MSKQRKVIQIEAAVCDDQEFLYALCDDGTIWASDLRKNLRDESAWISLENVPQPPPLPERFPDPDL
jgi:hypothetical protein